MDAFFGVLAQFINMRDGYDIEGMFLSFQDWKIQDHDPEASMCKSSQIVLHIKSQLVCVFYSHFTKQRFHKIGLK